jgi:hypothetical protein
MSEELQELRRENSRFRTALAFYADRSHYKAYTRNGYGDLIPGPGAVEYGTESMRDYLPAITADGGEQARRALDGR